MPASLLAQSSGSWTFNGDASWSVASNWSPDVPNNGGVATLALHRNQSGWHNITLDLPITLSGLTFDSAYLYRIPNKGTNSITLTGAATVFVPQSDRETPYDYASGHSIYRPITGSNGLVKTGDGVLVLTGTNTYTGGTTVLAGKLVASDLQLGAPGSTITLNGGTLAGSVTSGRPVVLGPAGGTFDAPITTTINGVISGSGAFNKTGGSRLFLQAANTFAGPANFNARGTNEQYIEQIAAVELDSDASILNASEINSADVIYLYNNSTVPNRGLPTVRTTLFGSGLDLSGPAACVAGEVIVDGGETVFTVEPITSKPSQITFTSIHRNNGGTMFFRGTNLGATPGNGVSNIFISTAPTLIGGGGTTATNASIIAGGVGAAAATTSFGDTFVTYGPTGVRPLATSEYVGSLAAAGPTDNVRTFSSVTLNTSQTINSLVVPSGSISGTGTLNITSGQVIMGNGSSVNFGFGNSEAVLDMVGVSSGTLSGVITGLAGLTKAGIGQLYLVGSNTYAGPTTATEGALIFGADVLPDVPGPLGNSNDVVVLAPGDKEAALLGNVSGAVFSRNLDVIGNGTGIGIFGSQKGALTVSGDIFVDRQVDLQSVALLTINGAITGPGRVHNSGSIGSIILNHSNSYSGGTVISSSGRFFAGDDHAFGTGMIWSDGTIGAIGGPRTIANPISGGVNVGSISGGGQDITFTGPLDLGGGFGDQVGPIPVINVVSGITATFTGDIRNGKLEKNGAGVLRVLGTTTYTGGARVIGGQLIARNLSNGTLAIDAGSVQLTAKPAHDLSGTSVIPAITIAAGAQLDLTSNAVVIDYDVLGTQLTDLRGQLFAGRLTSTTLAPGMAVGYADAVAIGVSSFGGVPVDTTSLVIGETYGGDANLDGTVNALDFNAVANNFGGGSNQVWSQGDFNYDGAVTTQDFTLMAINFNRSLPASLPGSVVPEPCMLGAVCAAAGLFRRRPGSARRRQRVAN